eukprot:scaffold19727_cov23-Prasinocladus_malaysianus.AAC.2
MGGGTLLADLAALGVTAAGASLALGLWKATPWLLGEACAGAASGAFPLEVGACTAAGSTLFGLARWQWLSISAFAANCVSVSVPGRIDNRMAEQARQDRKAGASEEDAPGVPRDSRKYSLT